jgi:citrate lyase subunit beta/citryl-CoA lyase
MPSTTRVVAPRPAEAGRAGADVRSDLRARFEPRLDGGLEVELLRSKVRALYGAAIVAQALEVLDGLGIRHGRLEIEDEGALPFTIAARIECAVRRAGHGAFLRAPVERALSWEPSARDALRRSRLYLPGNDPKLCVNAGLYGADGLILDLEDSVHAAEKDAARILVRNALRAVDFGRAERMVRINQLPLGLDDLEEIVPERPQLLLIPKVETPDQVQAVDARVRALLEGDDWPVWLMPILESARGIENALAIAASSPRVAALTIGLEDYTADLGVPKTRDGAESAWARGRLVQAARAAGVQAIDSVYGDFGDLDGLAAWARRARGLGFVGMGCIHPSQVEVLHRAFAPEPDEIERALRIVAAFEDAQRRGSAVVSLGSKMIDPPVVQRALRLCAEARAVGLLGAERTEGAR